ncbi:MAG: hypothetical protein V2I67_09225 [Thermoanaerobaculales bacterium]|jgi:hypothetical protein|nr:hypothetical protein [Thermoanaerobaculales bacterium]
MRRGVIIAVFLMAAATTASAQFVAPGGAVPVVANLPGLNNTDWRTDVSIVNLADTETSVLMLLQPEIADGEPAFEPVLSEPVSIAAGEQRTLRNIVEAFFGMSNTKGALSVFTNDGAPLVISARIYTLDDDGGSYGQNVEGVLVANTAWAAGIAHDDFYRTNFGIYLPFDPPVGQTTRFVVNAFDRDGEQVGTANVYFTAAGVQQRSLNALGVQGLLDGYLEIRCLDPSVAFYAYASRVDQVSGDAVFRQAKGRQSDLP